MLISPIALVLFQAELASPVTNLMSTIGMEPSLRSAKMFGTKANLEGSVRTYWNSSRTISVTIGNQPTRSDDKLLESWSNFTRFCQGPFTPETKIAPSGLPLGEKCYFGAGELGFGMAVVQTKEAIVTIKLFGRVRRDGTILRGSANELPVYESVLRWSIGSASAGVMRSQPVNVNGVSVAGLRARSGCLLANVEEYAAKKSLSFTLDETKAVGTLRVGDKVVTVPIGSTKIRVNSSWIALPHAVPVVGSSPYLPVRTIQQLMG